MEKVKIDPPANDLAGLLHDMAAQLTVLSLTLGCALKATAHREPARAKAIEDNLRLLMEAHDMTVWPERAKALLDLMYTALQERSQDAS